VEKKFFKKYIHERSSIFIRKDSSSSSSSSLVVRTQKNAKYLEEQRKKSQMRNLSFRSKKHRLFGKRECSWKRLRVNSFTESYFPFRCAQIDKSQINFMNHLNFEIVKRNVFYRALWIFNLIAGSCAFQNIISFLICREKLTRKF
jgi:hypothetical protein